MEWITTLVDFTAEQTGWNRDLAAAGLSSLPSAILWTLYYLLWGRRSSRAPLAQLAPPAVETYIPSDLALKLRDYLKAHLRDWNHVPEGTYNPEQLYVPEEFCFNLVNNNLTWVALDGKPVALPEKDRKFLQSYLTQTLERVKKDLLAEEEKQSLQVKHETLQKAEKLLTPPAPESKVVTHTYTQYVPYIPHELTQKLCKFLDDPKAEWTYEGTYREAGKAIQKIKYATLEIHAHKTDTKQMYGLLFLKQDGVDITSTFPYYDLTLIDLSLDKRMRTIMQKVDSQEKEKTNSLVARALDILTPPPVKTTGESPLKSRGLCEGAAWVEMKPTVSGFPVVSNPQITFYNNTQEPVSVPLDITNYAGISMGSDPYSKIISEGVEFYLYKGTPVYKNSHYWGIINGKEVELFQMLNKLYYKAKQ